MKTVAIIIPVYNVSDYIESSIYSVINQSYTNIEIILVDDGSTDDSLNKCLEYLEKDDRIHIIKKNNGGLSSARNAGIKYVFRENFEEDVEIIEKRTLDEIDYVQFFDSDDILNKYCIESSISLIEDADFTSFNFSYFTDGTDEVNKGLLDFDIDSELKCMNPRDFLIDRVGHIISWAWRGMIKKDILQNLRFKENMEYEDALFGTKLFYYSKKVQFIPESLILYRLRDNSIMNFGAFNCY